MMRRGISFVSLDSITHLSFRQSRSQHLRRRFNVLPLNRLRRTPERGIAQLRIPLLQLNAAHNLFIQQPLAPERRSLRSINHKLMESRRAFKEQLHSGLQLERLCRKRSLGQVVLGQLANAFLAIHSQKDRRHQRHKRLIGTDV